MATKTKPRVGDSRWTVEWCHELAFDEGGDVNHDKCKMAYRHVDTENEAAAIAREVWPQTNNAFGVVEYYPAEFVAYDDEDAGRYPHVGFWEITAEPQFYAGPDDGVSSS